jgi:hypothetical protein
VVLVRICQVPTVAADFYKLIPGKEFEREVRRIERELPRLSDAEVVFRLMRLGARLGVAHTWVGFPPKGPTTQGYPVMLHWLPEPLGFGSNRKCFD